MFYRVWNAINNALPTYYPVECPAKGWALIQELKKQQEKDPKIICNTFGLHVLTGNTWKEWEDALLRTINEFDDPIDF